MSTVGGVADYQQGLTLANAVLYGLSSSIFTGDLGKALHIVEPSEVGLTHVSIHSAYKEPQHCFGGSVAIKNLVLGYRRRVVPESNSSRKRSPYISEKGLLDCESMAAVN
jgi:acyl-CoA reductase-like NAD-dependent aldehyde dehydrogenase